MNLNKALLFLISVIFIFVSIFMIKHEIKDVAKKYLPIKVQSIIKILKNDKSFSKRLNNDYNVNFLPITQFIELNYASFRLDFVNTAKASYFQRLVKKTNK